jgi:hypothetical protein
MARISGLERSRKRVKRYSATRVTTSPRHAPAIIAIDLSTLTLRSEILRRHLAAAMVPAPLMFADVIATIEPFNEQFPRPAVETNEGPPWSCQHVYRRRTYAAAELSRCILALIELQLPFPSKRVSDNSVEVIKGG